MALLNPVGRPAQKDWRAKTKTTVISAKDNKVQPVCMENALGFNQSIWIAAHLSTEYNEISSGRTTLGTLELTLFTCAQFH